MTETSFPVSINVPQELLVVNQICGCDRGGFAPQVSRRSVGSRWINVGRLWAVAVCRPQAAHMFAAFGLNPRAVHTQSGQQ